MIEIKNLSKSFGPKNVLNDVSLKINDGDTYCIIGKSGTGKSVLIKHIVGLLEPDKGSVVVDGHEIAKLSQKNLFLLRKTMGYVFQGAALFDSLTVFENVILGLYEHGERDQSVMDKEARRVLEAVSLLPDIEQVGDDKYNAEWNILKNKKPSDLSGGMKKRVGVARALVGSPKYIFFDEPTTGLDPVTSEQIDNLIADITKRMNVTSIVITHDMFSVFKVADSVAMLNDGKILYDGSPEGLKQSKDKFVIEFLERYQI